jgi:hypothetical protein
MFSWLVFDAYMGGQGFIGLEWMPNTPTPILNQSKKKDKYKFKQNLFQNLKITPPIFV